MPNLTGEYEPSQRMGNGKGLPELRPMSLPRDLLGKDSVRVNVKAVEVVAQKDRARLAKGANVEFRRGAGV